MLKASAFPHDRAQAPTAASMRPCTRERPSAVPYTGTASGPAQANGSQQRRRAGSTRYKGSPETTHVADRPGARKSPRPNQIHGSSAVLQAGTRWQHESTRSTRSRLQQAAQYFSPSLVGSAGCAARARSRSARTARAARTRQMPSQQSQISLTATLHSSESMQEACAPKRHAP